MGTKTAAARTGRAFSEEAEVQDVEIQEPAAPAALVDCAVAGADVSGEFRCADCGYGAVVQRALPPCPMCGGTVWKIRLRDS